MKAPCIFGKDCPLHRLQCGLCHGKQVKLPLINWHINMDIQGFPSFWANDIHWRRFPICKMHFLEHFALDEEDIVKLYKSERRMFA